MTIVTLTTDFGLSDGYVGTMKGVILSIAPDVTLVDITHDIAPQHIRQAACALHAAAPYFPPETIHLAVVDPGVGSDRRALVVRTARGVDMAEFGPRITDPVMFSIPTPTQQPDGSWLGCVLYADHFGNLITSVTGDLLQRIGDVEITMGQRRIAGLYRAYAQATPGELVALVGSSGRLEISIVNGNAAQILGLGPDAPLILRKRQGIDSKLQEA
jgi:S-adenosylmethionine hydrolase